MITSEFLITALIVVLLPGTGVIYTVSTGLFVSGRASIAAALGCTAGIIPHLLASILGLAALLHMSALAFQALKFTGVAYLLYLAWSMWRDTGAIAFDQRSTTQNTWRIIRRGFLINILNPKLSIFFLAFLPQFVIPGGTSPLPQMLLLSAVFMAMTFTVFVLYGCCAHVVRAYVINSPTIILRLQRTFALTFAALGVKLAASEQ